MQKKNTWDLSPLFKSEEDPQLQTYIETVNTETHKFIDKWKNNQEYLNNPEVMCEAIEDYENWAQNYGIYNKLGYYLGLRSAQDEENPKIKAKYNKYIEIATELGNKMRFFEHNIAMIPAKDQKKFLEAKKLQKYKNFLQDNFDNAKHLLSEAEENLLSLKAPTSYSNWVQMTSEFLSKEEAKIKNKNNESSKYSFSEILGLLDRDDKVLRDNAAKILNKIFKKHLKTAEHEINSILQDKKVNDQLRKYKTPDESRLFGDNIEKKVIDTLIKAVSENYQISQNYYKLKAKLLGVDKLKYHERIVPIGELKTKYPYEDAIKIVDSSLLKLDKEFSEIFNSYMKNNQFDVFPRKNKTGGAFCASDTKIQPTYILLNHTDSVNDLLTIAHETGHGINNEFIKKSQSELYFGNSMAIAEVSSTFMEDFVVQELLEKSDKEEQFSLMIMKLDSEIATIFRQIACYQFELELHTTFREKGYLTKEEIGEIFQKHMSAYMGDFVEQSEGSENWWIYWSHIRNYFYVYSYASGLLISKSMQRSYKENNKFIEKVKYLLSAGTSDTPKNIFANIGIDITKKDFWLKGLKEINDLLNQTEKLAKELGKI